MILLDCQQLRRDYGKLRLSVYDVDVDPLKQFVYWYDDAIKAGNMEPHAMVLATTDAQHIPDTRIVLLKEVTDDGFVFYTHYQSPKGQEIAANPTAALNFYWPELTRQVRIRGHIERVSASRSAAYFATRSRESQLAVYAEHQSAIIGDNDLASKFQQTAERFAGQTVPCPPFWGGYCLTPFTIEFFQGRDGRLHDRVRYYLKEDAWFLEKLAP